VVILMSAVHFAAAAVVTYGTQVYYWDGDHWETDRMYTDPSWIGASGFDMTTLPESGTDPYLIVGYFGRTQGARAFGSFGSVTPEWDAAVFYTVAIAATSETSDLVFTDVEMSKTETIDVPEGYFSVGVLLRPEEGHTWADAPDGYLGLQVRGTDVVNPTTNVGISEPFSVIRAQAIAYVDATNGSDHTGDGSPENPYKDLLSGIGAVRDGTVYLLPGTYDWPRFHYGNRRDKYQVLGARRVRVIGTGRPVIASWFWVAEGGECAVEGCDFELASEGIRATYESTLLISDASIRGASIISADKRANLTIERSAILDTKIVLLQCFEDAVMTIRDAAIVANAPTNTSSLPVYVAQGHLRMENVLLADNDMNSDYVFWVRVSGRLELVHTTIAGNEADVSVVYLEDTSTCDIANSVVYGQGLPLLSGSTAQITATFSDIEGGWDGAGNIDSDPLFVDPTDGDYHIAVESPCVDAGSPAYATLVDLDGLLRDAIPDMGAFEAGCFKVPGDLSCDGIADLLDVRLCYQIATGVLAVTAEQYAAADVDGDGDVDEDDAEILAEYVIGVRMSLP